MKATTAILICAAGLLSACGNGDAADAAVKGAHDAEVASAGQAAREGALAGAQARAADEAAAPVAATVALATPRAASGAPVFAPLYPGAVIADPATVAQGPDGPGGIVSFTTTASPDQVVAFYRQKAEAAGLASVNSMDRGDAKAYGAASASGGDLLNVVADGVAPGETHVQLSWTQGAGTL